MKRLMFGQLLLAATIGMAVPAVATETSVIPGVTMQKVTSVSVASVPGRLLAPPVEMDSGREGCVRVLKTRPVQPAGVSAELVSELVKVPKANHASGNSFKVAEAGGLAFCQN